MRRLLQHALTALAALFALLPCADVASAAPAVPAGETTFTFSPQASAFLSDRGISVAPVGSATGEGGGFSFPVRFAIDDRRRFERVRGDRGGLRFSQDGRSAVVRGFVTVRLRRGALLLAQVPGEPGACGFVGRVAIDFLERRLARLRKAGRRSSREQRRAVRRAIRWLYGYCTGKRVILVARLTKLDRSFSGGTATLTGDVELSQHAANILNRRLDADLSEGSLLGSVESTLRRADP